MNDIFNDRSPFDSSRHLDEHGNEFWFARELMPLLGYKRWDSFEDATERAKISFNNASTDCLLNHISEVENVVKRPQGGGSTQKDYKFSRYFCYLIAMNGDVRKKEIASAQSYFAVKTRQAELEEQRPMQSHTQEVPRRDSVDYIEAIDKLNKMPESSLKQLAKDILEGEMALKLNAGALPDSSSPNKTNPPKKLTILAVRASQLGYSVKSRAENAKLGKFIKHRVEPAFQEYVGRFPTWHYEITQELDDMIHEYFRGQGKEQR